MPSPTSIWKCAACGKEFAKANQSHKCEIVPVEELFIGKHPALWELYGTLLARMEPIGEWTVTTSKKAITIYAANKIAFMGLQVKKDCLDVWFVLDHHMDEFPVYKVMQASKHKFGSCIRLYEPADITQTLIKWLEMSNQFIRQKG